MLWRPCALVPPLPVRPRVGRPREVSLPALPEPSTATVAAMHDGCRAVEAWMEATDDIAALAEADDWLDAVETYLSAKNAEGPAQTTHRLLDARVGDVMGPDPGYGHPEKEEYARVFPRAGDRKERRLIARHRDVWVDKLPLPRRRVLRLIRDDDADLRPIPEAPTELLCDLRPGDFRQVLKGLPHRSAEHTS